ncbi:MAG: chemotaxis protein CheW [Thermosynechococcaceae cyanobacterium]
MTELDALSSSTLAPELRNSAYQLFIQEAVELFEQIETDLHGLNPSQNAELLPSLIKALQIVRSGAEQLELTDFRNAIYRLETFCLTLHLKDIAALDLLRQANQTLKLSLLAHAQRIPLTGDINCTAAQAVLDQLEALRRQPSPQGGVPHPSSATQLTALALRAEVEATLGQIENLLAASPPTPTLAIDLKVQIEGLRDLGEMSDLSEFVAISQTALTSLNASPNSASTIGQITLTGYRSIYDQMQIENVFAPSPLVPVALSPLELPIEQLSLTTKTLPLADAFVWRTGGNMLMLPSQNMLEILIPRAQQVDKTQTPWTLAWRSQIIPVYPLAKFESAPYFVQGRIDPQGVNPQPTLLVINQSNQLCAIQVEIERLITASTIELQVSSFQENRPAYYRGTTVIDNRHRLIVIDVGVLLEQELRLNSALDFF